MKKVVCLILVLVLCMVLAVPALAYDSPNVHDYILNGNSENEITIDDDSSCHFLIFNGTGQKLIIENELRIDGLSAICASSCSLVVRGRLYSDRCIFIQSGKYLDVVLEEDGVIDLVMADGRLDLDLEALRAKGYCVYYEDNHLIISYRHRDADICGSCSFCHRECNHPYDDYVFDGICGHCGHGIMNDEKNDAKFINDSDLPKEYTVYGIQNYDNFIINEDVSVFIDKDARVNIRGCSSEGNLVIYGSVNVTDDYVAYYFENIVLKDDGVFECIIPYDYEDIDGLMATLRQNGAGCLSLDGDHLHASVKHHYDWDGVCRDCGEICTHEKRNGAVCAECGNVAEHECEWNDGVCTLCGAICEDHFFDANGVCYYCGHVRTLNDTLQDWISEDLVLPAGNYTTKLLRIEPGVTVTLEKGAELHFTEGISTMEATLVIRGSLIGFTDQRNRSEKDVGTVILEEDGMIDIFSSSNRPVGTAGIGAEFVKELQKDSTVRCFYYEGSYFGFVHIAKNHTFDENGYCCYCGCLRDASNTGSVLSDGNLWIIIAVAVVAIGGVAALVIVKKKKQPAVASGTDNTDEE